MIKKRGIRIKIIGNKNNIDTGRIKEYAICALVFALFIFTLFYFTSINGNIIVGVSKEEQDLVKTFENEKVKPKLIVGYQLGPEDIKTLDTEKFTPFLKVSYTKDMCVNNIFYTCENGQPSKAEQCKYGCDEKGCLECIGWTEWPGGGMIAPKIKGNYNKCIGNDVYRCINGRWKFTATCEFGCTTSPLLERNPSINQQEVNEYLSPASISKNARDIMNGFVGNKQRLIGRPPRDYKPRWGEENAEKYTVGHCRCFFGYENICAGDDLYQCLGYKDEYFYTKIEACKFGCEDGKCLKRRKTCDPKMDLQQCVGGSLWKCQDSFWINSHNWCEVGPQYNNPSKKQNQNVK